MESPANVDNDTGQGGISSGSESSSRKRPQTVSCFLCGGTQIYPGPRYENHLINEHGVLDIDFMIAITLYKQKHGSNPSLENPINSKEPSATSNNVKESSLPQMNVKQTTDASNQTNLDIICSNCTEVVEFDDLSSKKSNHRPINGISKHNEEGKTCSRNNVENYDDEYSDEEKYAALLATTEYSDRDNYDSSAGTTTVRQDPSVDTEMKRRSVSEQWGPNSWSSTFTCHFCHDQFRKDYKLKLHLMLNHQDEDPQEMATAMEVLTKGKLDGCVHKCGLCDSKFNSVANISRHLNTVHQMTRAQYTEMYGSSEIVSRVFKCEICDVEIKHTRAIISSHMKYKHLISWKEYQDIVLKIKQGIIVGDLPKAELFDCMICGASVKYQSEHLRKTHQISVEVYEQILERKAKGENINKMLPRRKVYECMICNRETMNLSSHLVRTHQITLERYQQDFDVKEKTSERKSNPNMKYELSYMNGRNAVHNYSGGVDSPVSSQADIESNDYHTKHEELSQLENQSTTSQSQPLDSSFDTVHSYSSGNSILIKPPKSDILNKHNKKCSSCSVIFESRKTFINHCARDHNMTFRAKTGATICAPAMSSNVLQELSVKSDANNSNKNSNFSTNQVVHQVPLEQQIHFKRTINEQVYKHEVPISDYELEERYPSKRLRYNNLISPIISVGTGGKRILHLQAGRNKWNQCRYECCFCKQSTMTRGSMTSHIRDIHGLHIKDYKESGYPDIEIETNWFQCRLCTTRTKFVKDCIEPHVKMSHSMSLDTYERECMKEEDWPYHVVTYNGDINMVRASFDDNDNKCNSMKRYEESNNPKKEPGANCPYTNCWANEYTFAESSLLDQHLVEVHNFSTVQDLSKISMLQVKKENIKTEILSEEGSTEPLGENQSLGTALVKKPMLDEGDQLEIEGNADQSEKASNADQSEIASNADATEIICNSDRSVSVGNE